MEKIILFIGGEKDKVPDFATRHAEASKHDPRRPAGEEAWRWFLQADIAYYWTGFVWRCIKSRYGPEGGGFSPDDDTDLPY